MINNDKIEVIDNNPIKSKLFSEKNIGEVDNDSIRPGTVPEYLLPIFNGSLYVSHMCSWELDPNIDDPTLEAEQLEKEKLYREFKGEYCYGLKTGDTIKDIIKGDFPWIVKLFENPHDV